MFGSRSARRSFNGKSTPGTADMARSRKHARRQTATQALSSSSRAVIDSLEPRTHFSTYTVNALGDPSFSHQGQVTLRRAVAEADANPGPNTIDFSPTVFPMNSTSVITLTLGALELSNTTGTIDIVGPGRSSLEISGNSTSQIFTIDAGVTAQISGVTLANGSSQTTPISNSYGGGAIMNLGNLTIANSTLNANGALTPNEVLERDVLGGAIFSSGPLTLQSDIFTNNTAATSPYSEENTGAGGAVYATSSLTINGCNFLDNSADGTTTVPTYDPTYPGVGEGGAIYVAGTLTASNSNFGDNNAIAGTGGQIPASGPPMDNAYGGAIYSATSATLTNCSVAGNEAKGGLQFESPCGAAYGGAVWSSGTLDLVDSTVSGNQAVAGVTVYAVEPKYAAIASPGPAEGGGVFCQGRATITQSTIADNSAQGSNTLGTYYASEQYLLNGGGAAGGGVYCDGPVAISDSTISGDTATGGAGVNAVTTNTIRLSAGNGGAAIAGGLWCVSGSITNTTIANNKVTGGAGGAATAGAPAGETVAGSGGDANGGGVLDTGSLQIYDSTVTGNSTAGGAAGAKFGHIAAGSIGTATGGGIAFVPPSLHIEGHAPIIVLDNTIVSGNLSAGAFNDISGTLSTTSAYNLIGVGGGLTNGVNGNEVGITNPGLAPLGNYGGTTQTRVPLLMSPALSAGSVSLIPAGVTTDQRGLARTIAGKVDIGADESGGLTLSGAAAIIAQNPNLFSPTNIELIDTAIINLVVNLEFGDGRGMVGSPLFR